MELVLDANVLFSALIKQDTTFRLILHEDIHLYAPEFILIELAKHKTVILEKTGKGAEEFEKVLVILRRYIQFVPLDALDLYLKQAEHFSPDPKDTAYLALALRMKIPIWSNDKALQSGQNSVKVLSTKEVMAIVGH